MTYKERRLSEQPIMSQRRLDKHHQSYDLYPFHTLAPGSIEMGLDALVAHLVDAKRVMIDGYVGVFWTDFVEQLKAALARQGRKAHFFDVSRALHAEETINRTLRPSLGGDDPIFGTRTNLGLADLFDNTRLPQPSEGLSIVYGCGAALCSWPDALTVYIDLPKNELQFRSRAGAVANLGLASPLSPSEAYKRFYFVDWVMLNKHKQRLLPQIDLFVDGQRVTEPTFIAGQALRAGLNDLSTASLRVRPWMEPGAWGGQWLKTHIKGLVQNVPNYAWSFELIVPENGLVFESDGWVLEVSFDVLMYQESNAILGSHGRRFGTDFPIRFDYLDTIGGGNLSVQCHPRPEYMKAHFGEDFTQDETYYIVHCEADAKVYLGFNESVDREAFFEAVTHSQQTGTSVEIERFLNVEQAEQHGLYLIPNGTVHSSGEGNLVLEISATPYIFTFKIYDWLRVGLDGQPRPLNVERAFANLYFADPSRQGKALVAEPVVLEETADRRIVHLPTHAVHFYDVRRLEFSARLEVNTSGSPHVLCLVEGERVTVRVAGRAAVTYSFAETFIIPAAVARYTLESSNGEPLKIVQAFLKPLG